MYLAGINMMMSVNAYIQETEWKVVDHNMHEENTN